MKTGIRFNENRYIDIGYITLVALDSILKRLSLKDMLLYITHNDLPLSSDLFCHSVCFNLFSEWGVGKKMEPIIIDTFRNSELLSEKYADNVFYKEASQLSEEIVSQIRSEKSLFEWSYVYTTNSIFAQDDISLERSLRLFPLIENEDDSSPDDSSPDNRSTNNSTEDDITDDSITENTECFCNFCVEFSKYCYPKTQTVEEIVTEVIKRLS